MKCLTEYVSQIFIHFVGCGQGDEYLLFVKLQNWNLDNDHKPQLVFFGSRRFKDNPSYYPCVSASLVEHISCMTIQRRLNYQKSWIALKKTDRSYPDDFIYRLQV